MKIQRSFNVLTFGLLFVLIGSLLLNLYQLNERNRLSAEVMPLRPVEVQNNALSDDLAIRRPIRKDSLHVGHQPNHLTKSPTHF